VEHRIFGDIPGISVGTTFTNRHVLHDAGIHRPLQAGISGSGAAGADSIVVSGGYEDDVDLGTVIVYTGQGGNDPTTGKQIADQQLTRGNLALARSCLEGLPIRVIRGAGGEPSYAPSAADGYRYDGLFYIEDYWHELGKSGYRIWRFRLVQEPQERTSPSRDPQSTDQPPSYRPMAGTPSLVDTGPAKRTETRVQRLVRNTTAAMQVKALYQHTCQICSMRLETPAGFYAEGAHIRPLGRPHDGPDVLENLRCLCPNDHVRFDTGALVIDEDLSVVDLLGNRIGRLRVAPGHCIRQEFLAYHRTHYQMDQVNEIDGAGEDE
jgi:putative restriction endonuclease